MALAITNKDLPHGSLILIGMPGSGKSTLGRILAELLHKDFVDTDLLIERLENTSLQNIIDLRGYRALRAVEETVLLNTFYLNHVIATGGSAVYSDSAMHHLATFGPIIFLDVALPQLLLRIQNMDSRGIARSANQSFEDLYNERRALYIRYAKIIIDCNGKTETQIINDIMNQIDETKPSIPPLKP